MIEPYGDLAACELRLAVEWPTSERRTGRVAVTRFGRRAVLAVERLAVGDHIGVTGWLRAQPVDAGEGRTFERVDVVVERLDFLGPRPCGRHRWTRTSRLPTTTATS